MESKPYRPVNSQKIASGAVAAQLRVATSRPARSPEPTGSGWWASGVARATRHNVAERRAKPSSWAVARQSCQHPAAAAAVAMACAP